MIYPSITTMRQPKKEIAQKAVEILMGQINEDQNAFNVNSVLHAECIVRKSTEKVKAELK
jgi:DNA-binding LacI/PurR family transcriptional regulator